MKYNLLIFFNLFLFNVYGQKNKINKKDIIGCWEFVEYVDTAKMQPLSTIMGAPYSIEFKPNGQYENVSDKGNWIFDNQRKITLYKSEFTAEEKEMAVYFKTTPREATKSELSDIKMDSSYIYFLIVSEIEPFAIYQKMKRKICK